jgi:DNA-binding HxlR family transcriptional regulator
MPYDALPSVLNCDCPSQRVLELITRKWTALIIAVLAEGTHRYSELQNRIQGVSQKVLTETLRALERDGLVTRIVHAEIPPRVEYSLTELGRSLKQILVPVCRWAEEHLHEVEAFRRQAVDSAAKAGGITRPNARRRESPG